MITCKECIYGKYYDDIKDWDCNLSVKELDKCPNLDMVEFILEKLIKKYENLEDGDGI